MYVQRKNRTNRIAARARSDQSVSPILRQHDDLPAFAVLTTDDERERKAETQSPGTYGVVVTPSSFADLPEYAEVASSNSRQTITNSYTPNSIHSPSLGGSLKHSRTDPNVIVLDRFEDVSPSSAGTFSLPSPARRPSLPDGIQYLTINTTPSSVGSMLPRSPLSQVMRTDEHLISHFRHYVFPRLVQPRLEGTPNDPFANPIRDAFEIEASQFTPLYHAICAVSALNLSYSGRSTMEEALQHYHQAISPQTAASSPDDLSSDGTFLRHFLLFVYDICSPMQDGDSSGANLWAIHLNHLMRIAIERHKRLGHEPYGYILWTICELDMYACLLGNGNCEFVQTIVQHNMLPPLEHQIPHAAASISGPYLASEMPLFPRVLSLNQRILIGTVKLAQTARNFRLEAANGAPVTPGRYAGWAAAAYHLQHDISSAWLQSCPEHLVSELPAASVCACSPTCTGSKPSTRSAESPSAGPIRLRACQYRLFMSATHVASIG